ncbi:MAG: hypothetical protein ACLUIR_02025 [Faecalibacterium prausnitzii]
MEAYRRDYLQNTASASPRAGADAHFLTQLLDAPSANRPSPQRLLHLYIRPSSTMTSSRRPTGDEAAARRAEFDDVAPLSPDARGV